MPQVTWTPAIQGTGGNPTYTATNTIGEMYRVGQRAFFRVRIDWTGLSGGSGQLTVTGPSGVNISINDYAPVFFNNVTFTEQVLARGRFTNAFQFVSNRSGLSEGITTIADLGASGRIAFSGEFRL